MSEARKMGRPRDPRVDEAVFAAVESLLVERGYNGFGLQAVAQRAGVGHSSVYRRWPSKAHLVHEVLYPADAGLSALPDTDDIGEIVRALVAGTIATYSRPTVLAATPGLLAELHADPELRRALGSRIETGFRAELHDAVAAGIDDGRVRPGVDADALLDAISGAVLFALFVDPRMDAARLDDTFAAALTDLLVGGMLPRGR